MALRKIGDDPLDRAQRLAITRAEALEAQRDAEARAAFEATFKRAKGPPPTLPPIGKSLRERPNDEESTRVTSLAMKILADAEDEARATSGLGPGVGDPLRSVARGPGVGGGVAGRETEFTVHTKDEADEDVTVGGASIDFTVRRGSGSKAVVVASGEGSEQGDGTYACSYLVDSRGDYFVEVRMNGIEIRGSPYEVFYTAPLDGPMMSERRAFVVPRAGNGDLASTGMCRDFLVGKCDRVICKFRHDTPPPPPPMPSGEGFDPAAAKPEELRRTAHVSNLPVAMTLEQVKQLFSFCGTILECREGGSGRNFAFIEFSSDKEALAALALNGMNVGGRNIRVESAKLPKLLTPARLSSPTPLGPQMGAAEAAQAAAARAAAISARLVAKAEGKGADVRHKPY